jgi:hypothetical protein
MDAKRKKRIVIWVSIAALLGVGGYVAYKLVKAKRDKKKAEEEAKNVAQSSSSTPTSSGGSAPTGSFTTSAPLYPDDVKKFQDWMDKNHPNWVGATNFMLNNGKSLNRGSGYGNFGKSTKKAYEYFGKQWKESITNPSATSVVSGWGLGNLIK